MRAIASSDDLSTPSAEEGKEEDVKPFCRYSGHISVEGQCPICGSADCLVTADIIAATRARIDAVLRWLAVVMLLALLLAPPGGA